MLRPNWDAGTCSNPGSKAPNLPLGCDALCDTTIDFYWKTNPLLTLGIVANWVVPIIALLAALPYDSLHEDRIGRTLSTLASWLGSPQTALTATIFNIYQLARCKSATKVSVLASKGPQNLAQEAFYVLSCIGQFRLQSDDDPRSFQEFTQSLSYALFRPLVGFQGDERSISPRDEDNLTPAQRRALARDHATRLIGLMAFQLRMLRRRGVYPAYLSIMIFHLCRFPCLGGSGIRGTRTGINGT